MKSPQKDSRDGDEETIRRASWLLEKCGRSYGDGPGGGAIESHRADSPTTANQNWLALTRETALEPQLAIIDPHHHFWDLPDRTPERYLLAQLVADTKGHNVRQTVFIECGSMYRADGPEEFRVVGETELVQGIAAESASGRLGDLRAAAGIVGAADLRLGDRIAPVLEAQIAASPQRFRGIRHGGRGRSRACCRIRAARASNRPAVVPHLLLDPDFRRGFALPAALRAVSSRPGCTTRKSRSWLTWRRRFRTRRSSSTISVGRSALDMYAGQARRGVRCLEV